MTSIAFASRAAFSAALLVPLLAEAAPPTPGFAVYSLAPQDGGAPALPEAPLVQIGGVLYGTSEAGGSAGVGTVFSMTKTGTTVLHSFAASPGGQYPVAGLLDYGGKLYGTTRAGGPYNQGVVFVVDPATGIETLIYAFGARPKDGAYPQAALVAVGERLFGTTAEGGAYGQGTVFRVTPFAPGGEATLHSFGATGDGTTPVAALLTVDTALYGTTKTGGAFDAGTVFKIDPSTGAESVVHAFAGGRDGKGPEAALIRIGHTLYGTTALGGVEGNQGGGTVFKLDAATGATTVLHAFIAPGDGAVPMASVLNINGMLYGTTLGGGTVNDGAVFKLDPSTGVESVLHSFDGFDGAYLTSALINVGGQLYGTAPQGGSNYTGVVFNLSPYVQ